MARTVNVEAHAKQRRRIIAAAAEEFAARGYEAATTAAVCRRAEIGSGTLFHYFPGKQQLLLAVFADDLPVLRDLTRRAARAVDPDDGLDLVIEHLLAEVADPLSPGLAAVALLRASQDPELASVLERGDAILQRSLVGLLRRVEREHPGRLVFNARSTARWIRAVVDGSHLGLGDGQRARSELARVFDWLLGRRSTAAPPAADPL